ncbi:phosphatase PAP2 family protein [Limimaricola hongkongensis]|uniref:phosphatase PAP2 family protein n=1 Tax=Limimaricola hongkongensis TaxID=278132 RepID=UPI000ACF7E9A|nr:phosphatase PAP2 family protein [Limimaricola hongkongensis]
MTLKFKQTTEKPHRNNGLWKEIIISLVCAIIFTYLLTRWPQSPWIIAMDYRFFLAFGSITQQSWAFDTMAVQIFTTNTFKIAPLLACIVWLVFELKRQGRSISFFGQLLLGSTLAMILSRVLQNFSAYRPRPLHNSDLAYELPYGIGTSALEGWSSFPSDTSALAFAIAAGIFLASKRLGVAAFSWVVVVVAFPRAYAGLHYPSDLIGGALIGLFCTFGASPIILRTASRRVTLAVNEKWVPLLWTLAFLYIFQMGSMFNDVRTFGSYAKTVLGL